MKFLAVVLVVTLAVGSFAWPKLPGSGIINDIKGKFEQLPVVFSYTRDPKYDALARNVVTELKRLKPGFNNFFETYETDKKAKYGVFDSISVTATSVAGFNGLTFQDVEGAEKASGETYLRGKLQTGSFSFHGLVKFIRKEVNQDKRFTATVGLPLTYEVTLRISSERGGHANVISLKKISPKKNYYKSMMDGWLTCDGLLNSVVNHSQYKICIDANYYIEERMKTHMENFFEYRLRKVLEETNPLHPKKKFLLQ